MKTVPMSSSDMAQVVFPRLTKKSVHEFRLPVPESEGYAGATTGS